MDSPSHADTSLTGIGDPYDVVGIGIGPMNLSLAALVDGVQELRSLFLDENENFSWHPGMMIDGAKLQVRFLGDLVSLIAPTSRWSLMEYLREHDRLYHFYFSESFYIPRREYDDYCRWVAGQLPSCVFGAHVESVEWNASSSTFDVTYVNRHSGVYVTVQARNVVLGVGTRPSVPESIAELVDGATVLHSADYRQVRESLRDAEDVTVIGAGQSGAEVFLDLLRMQADTDSTAQWYGRSPGFLPMEPSQLGQEFFTPDYSRYFQSLSASTRRLVAKAQWRIHKAISMQTLDEIHAALYERGIGGASLRASLQPGVALVAAERTHDRIDLRFEDIQQHTTFDVRTERVVLATGYHTERVPAVIKPISHVLRFDEHGHYDVSPDNRIALDPSITGGLFVQHGETHAHGIIATDLSHSPYRGARIINSIVGREVYRLPRRTAFATFGADAHHDHNPHIAEESLPA